MAPEVWHQHQKCGTRSVEVCRQAPEVCQWDHLSAEEKAKILAAEDASGEAAQQAETREREDP